MKLKHFLAVLVLAMAGSSTAFAEETMTSLTTDQFIQKAAAGNEFEVQSSQLALSRTNTIAVRDFASMMVKDHTKAAEDMRDVLQSPDLNMTPPVGLDHKHQEILEDLKTARAEIFDQKYIAAQTDAHKEAVSLFRDYSQNGDNESLVEFASDTLPTLEKHYEEITAIQSSQ